MQFSKNAPQSCETTAQSCCTRCKPAVPEVHDHHEEHHHAAFDDASLKEMLRSWHFITFCIGTGLFIIALLMDESHPLMFWTYLISFFLVGGEILYMALTNLFKGHLFDENFLMAVATVGAILLGEYPEGVAVMLFYQIGELFQSYAVGKSRRNISELMDIRPDYANIEVDGKLEQVDPDEVEVGTIIVVQPGEKIPIDGVIEEGNTTLNTSALTGESVPRDAREGDEVISGCINMTGVLKIRTIREFGESTVSKILELVENASSKKAKYCVLRKRFRYECVTCFGLRQLMGRNSQR